MRGAEHARRFDVTWLDELGSAIGVDQARRERAGEDDQHRPADAGAEPQGRERHPRDRCDEAQRVEERADDGIERAEPAHEQSERHADHRGQREAEAEAAQAREQMLLQRVAGEGGLQQPHELLPHREWRGQELRLHQAGERDQRPQAEERGEAGERQQALPHRRHGIASTSSRPSAQAMTPPDRATNTMPTTIIAGKRSSAPCASSRPRPAAAPISSPAPSAVQQACSERRRPVKMCGAAPGMSTSRTIIQRLTPSILAASITWRSSERMPAWLLITDGTNAANQITSTLAASPS